MNMHGTAIGGEKNKDLKNRLLCHFKVQFVEFQMIKVVITEYIICSLLFK